jgi:hypothetical protein
LRPLWRPKDKLTAIFDPKNIIHFFGHQNPGFGTASGSAVRKNAGSGSGSALNQCGSTTLKENDELLLQQAS